MNVQSEDRELPKPLTNEEYTSLHLRRFKEIRHLYGNYARFLKGVLKEARLRYAPLAIVDVRAKSTHSFVDKILRKRAKYEDTKDPQPSDPLLRMTDLCGGRIIVQTDRQVKDVCRFIERVFDIDTANSEDVSRRLKPTEFGYRSVHYIVMINPNKLEDNGVTVDLPAEVLSAQIPLKAEIQVRTILEHAWADLVHDTVYKTELLPPDHIRRHVSTLAAVLENVDKDFGRLVDIMLEYKSNFGAFHPRADMKRELEIRKIVLDAEPDNFELAAKSALLSVSIGDYESARNILKPYENEPQQGIQRALGITLTEMYWDNPRSLEYQTGRDLLGKACAHEEKDAETLCSLAESWVRDDDTERAGAFFKEALAVDPTEPVTLCRYLEFEIARNSNPTAIRVAAPLIQGATKRCYRQIEAGINVPKAWAALTLLHLFLNEPFKALNALACVIRLCDDPQSPSIENFENSKNTFRTCAPEAALLRNWEAMKRLSTIREKLDGYEWVRRGILLGLASKVQDEKSLNALRDLTSWKDRAPHMTPDDQVVILSGACLPELQPYVDELKPLLLRACEGLSFTLFSGGSRAGISGLSGEAADASKGGIRAFGYMPRLLPRGVVEDDRYTGHFSSSGDDFTPLDPFQGWTDILAAGLKPNRVKVLSYCGGLISRAEYQMALALGARVGVVDNTTLPVERQTIDNAWTDHPNLLSLPMDPMTLRAFLLVDEIPCKREEFEAAARMAHEEYVQSATPKDPSTEPWEKLDQDLKLSNYHQIAYAENILKTVGLGLREDPDRKAPLLDMKAAIGQAGILQLAEMEHGRWNVERLMRGWRLAEKKDIAKKQSPFLVPWDDDQNLPANIKEYDFIAIEKLPQKFREAGLEIYRLDENKG